MLQTMNFPLSTECIRPYGSWEALGGALRSLGLDGLELIADPENADPAFPPELAAGAAGAAAGAAPEDELAAGAEPEDEDEPEQPASIPRTMTTQRIAAMYFFIDYDLLS